MSASRDARLHPDEAKEFLEAAEANHDLSFFNAAASAAVTSGINSKDAMCLAPTFSRLLGVKARAQYQTRAMTRKGSNDAVAWASRMYEAAQRVVAG